MSRCEPAGLAASPGLPLGPEGAPVFPAPWAASAFALTVALHEKGLFGWDEWAAALSRALHRPGRAEDGSDYFDAWVEALSDLLTEKGSADAETLAARTGSWQRAAEATPHGTPIRLENDPERSRPA